MENRREILWWRTLAVSFGQDAPALQAGAQAVLEAEGLPAEVLSPQVSVESLGQLWPGLKSKFEEPWPAARAGEPVAEGRDLAKNAVAAKLLIDGFGPQTQTPTVSAAQYGEWLKSVDRLEGALGFPPGGLRSGRGGGPDLLHAKQLEQEIRELDADMVRRMALREVLADDRLAASLVPSMALLEHVLRDKANLDGTALKNARALVRKYVDEVAEVLKTKILSAPSRKIDRSVPPKRAFRNLDLDRTIWKNLGNWDAQHQRLLVDRLYYRRTKKRIVPKRLVVIVDQSGSMVDAMVQCTILASIFATLPHVDAHLIAFDTRVVDLTAWVHDPFEVLMRTQLGGGTHIRLAVEEGAKRVENPPDTVVVLISDFFEGGSNEDLLAALVSLRATGCTLLPVGAITGGGRISVCDWFKTRLKDLGMPILSGSVDKLVEELKTRLT